MSEVGAWFERKFQFTYPLELFPNLKARLIGTPARLEDIFRHQPHAALIAKPEGKWSAQEHAGHLLDLESLWLSRVEDFAAGKEVLTPADLRNQKTDEANHNARPLAGILEDFRTGRMSLMARVAGLDSSLVSSAIPHPRLKTPMRMIDHLYFAAEHDDHHLARIWELLG